jgi:hypothetical protein
MVESVLQHNYAITPSKSNPGRIQIEMRDVTKNRVQRVFQAANLHEILRWISCQENPIVIPKKKQQIMEMAQ